MIKSVRTLRTSLAGVYNSSGRLPTSNGNEKWRRKVRFGDLRFPGKRYHTKFSRHKLPTEAQSQGKLDPQQHNLRVSVKKTFPPDTSRSELTKGDQTENKLTVKDDVTSLLIRYAILKTKKTYREIFYILVNTDWKNQLFYNRSKVVSRLKRSIENLENESSDKWCFSYEREEKRPEKILQTSDQSAQRLKNFSQQFVDGKSANIFMGRGDSNCDQRLNHEDINKTTRFKHFKSDDVSSNSAKDTRPTFKILSKSKFQHSPFKQSLNSKSFSPGDIKGSGEADDLKHSFTFDRKRQTRQYPPGKDGDAQSFFASFERKLEKSNLSKSFQRENSEKDKPVENSKFFESGKAKLNHPFVKNVENGNSTQKEQLKLNHFRPIEKKQENHQEAFHHNPVKQFSGQRPRSNLFSKHEKVGDAKQKSDTSSETEHRRVSAHKASFERWKPPKSGDRRSEELNERKKTNMKNENREYFCGNTNEPPRSSERVRVNPEAINQNKFRENQENVEKKRSKTDIGGREKQGQGDGKSTFDQRDGNGIGKTSRSFTDNCLWFIGTEEQVCVDSKAVIERILLEYEYSKLKLTDLQLLEDFPRPPNEDLFFDISTKKEIRNVEKESC